ncbi:MAG: YueI family protein [Lactobacillus sp.]|nr:YueI family protein [Lactobacillus sp.]
MTEDLTKRVENAASGITPQTKPDERRRFLGSLRERVLVRMDNTEVKDPKLTQIFLDHIDDYHGYTILINGKMDNIPFLDKVEAICCKKDIKFTLVNNETAKTGLHDTAILVVAKDAINKPRVEIMQVYPPEIPKMELENSSGSKPNFWQRLFGGKR